MASVCESLSSLVIETMDTGTVVAVTGHPLQLDACDSDHLLELYLWEEESRSEICLWNGCRVRKGPVEGKHLLLEYVPPSSFQEAFPPQPFQNPHVVGSLWIWIKWFAFLWFNIMIKLLCTLLWFTEMKQCIFFNILCPLLVIFSPPKFARLWQMKERKILLWFGGTESTKEN